MYLLKQRSFNTVASAIFRLEAQLEFASEIPEPSRISCPKHFLPHLTSQAIRGAALELAQRLFSAAWLLIQPSVLRSCIWGYKIEVLG